MLDKYTTYVTKMYPDIESVEIRTAYYNGFVYGMKIPIQTLMVTMTGRRIGTHKKFAGNLDRIAQYYNLKVRAYIIMWTYPDGAIRTFRFRTGYIKRMRGRYKW